MADENAAIHVDFGFMPFPRGGSAEVVKELGLGLEQRGHRIRVVSGSLGQPGERSHAPSFFHPLETITAAYDDAVASFERGGDPLAAPVPLHASYEDRPGAPDRVMSEMSPELYEHQVRFWSELFRRHQVEDADVVHLHHLTPQYAALARRTDPIIGHLHGTELKLLNALQERPETAKQARWASFCREWMKRAAGRCAHLLVVSLQDRELAMALLDLPEEIVSVLPNGVDTDVFFPRPPAAGQALDLWLDLLVQHPNAWDTSGVPGSIRYSGEEVRQHFTNSDGSDAPVILTISRYLSFKRLPLLIEAYARARSEHGVVAPLVIFGGIPGEWEGEHPAQTVERIGVPGVFLAGWHAQQVLAQAINCAAVVVSASVDEPFGMTLPQAMACGRTVVATASGGPLIYVDDHSEQANGWLVPPDDEEAFAATLAEVMRAPEERARRAAAALRSVTTNYTWRAITARLESLYRSLITRRTEAGSHQMARRRYRHARRLMVNETP